ncbi:MAG TPA: RNA 2',3'-cyclic phosphodiesterase [Candidatus Bipolaricaulota bacterium]|nr:RNA 2',3'-cyclic phosphodiesterase [Candidatus Bipolaricaulota bacterium]
MRCFLAIEIPQNVKNQIFAMVKELKSLNTENRIKWTSPDNMHLTMQFIGEVEYDRLEAVKQSLSNIKFAPFDIEFDFRPSYFPNKTNPNIIKLSIIKGDHELKKINESIKAGLDKEGIEYEKKDFSPHLTLGRIKYLNGEFKEITISKINGFTVRNFNLYCSDLTEEGPIHTKLAQFNL